MEVSIKMGAMGSAQASNRLSMALVRPYLLAIPAAAFLCWFALYNGYPILYEDSIAYMNRPARALTRFIGATEWSYDLGGAAPPTSGAWLSGRSVYYGGFNAVLAVVGSIWLVIFMQGWMAAVAVAIPWFRAGLGVTSYLMVMALLAFTTTLPVFVGMLMPDLFAAVAILVVAALLWLWPLLNRLDVAALVLLGSYCVLSHDSILLLVGVMLALAVLLRLVRKGKPVSGKNALGAVVVICGVGVAGMLAFNMLAYKATGLPPLRLPHLSARLVTSDVGRHFLDSECAEHQFVVCRYRDRLDHINWIEFLFSRLPERTVFATASPAMKAEIEREQLALVASIILHDPIGTLSLFTSSVGEQLVSVSLEDFQPHDKSSFMQRNLSPELYQRFISTRAYDEGAGLMNRLSLLGSLMAVVAGFAIILILVRSRLQPAGHNPRQGFVLAILMGMFLNGALCAIFASPYSRFQARVMWLLPLSAAVLVVRPPLPVPRKLETPL